MKLKLDNKNDTLYFRLDDGKIVDSEEVKKGIILDFDENDNVIGIEFLNISKRIPAINFKMLQFETF
ncbi:MAG: hypothetical protein COS14_10115 [Bacteroidetes bacterium CG02_land_8_20_14_3_00_31_25]|nr:DUF2283 domain-containing protein [Bacteroidota bacterium]PIV58333.1 MAG: hypothetical protein COS14_10115 [Bacteroidetes bacterium CG02_land_8_20_14_3_00_31_25]PIX34190.1 MAG: hypothetical protein COZ59_08230 [Bacteroidetes bacterium CG_4_8_14_3_um_filter_31_14]PIY04853.1 MAG: hypothetical protein COZ21_05435 [Bacteroidetes bacterium CG_4_10_14_3_um_filter_31_20]